LRDGRCVISGLINEEAEYDNWVGYEAAHIFPLEAEDLWIEWDFGRWITDTTCSSKINSPQNGFLLDAGIHRLFDQYIAPVNPDVSAFMQRLVC